MVRSLAVLGYALATVLCTHAQDADPDLKKLQGTWALVAMEKRGQNVPAKDVDGVTATFTGTKMVLDAKRDRREFVIRLDPRRPRRPSTSRFFRAARPGRLREAFTG